MARFPRTHLPGAAYHVMGRGNGGAAIFDDTAEYKEFLEVLARLKETAPFELFAYCLMPNHLHLFLRVCEVALSSLMQRLLSCWARRFNISNARRGHVFQGRFKSILCAGDDYARRLVRYIHMNPVAAGLVAAPGDWEWSSHQDYTGERIGGLADVSWPLGLFGATPESGRRGYASFLAEKPADPFTDDTMDDGRAAPSLAATEPDRRAPLEFLLAQAAQAGGISVEVLKGRSRVRDLCAARRFFALHSSRAGHSVAAIAGALSLSPAAVSKMLAIPPAPDELSPQVAKVNV